MKVVFGVALGALLTFLLLEYGYTPPAPFKLPEKLKAIPEQLIATSFLEDAESGLEQRQKAVASLIKFDPNYYIEIDNTIGHRFTEEAVSKIVKRKLQLLKGYSKGFEKAFDKEKYPALRKRLEERYGAKDQEKLKRKIIMEKMRDDLLIHKHLQERFPGSSDEEIAGKIMRN